MSAIISAKGLTKRYGKQAALDHASFDVQPGRIVGLIGPNGSGKTTTLKAILGLTQFEGELSVLGMDPRSKRDELMRDVCFIADVAILPRWLKVKDAIDFVAGVHPRFDREKALRYIEHTKLSPNMRVKAMSKGMIVQLSARMDVTPILGRQSWQGSLAISGRLVVDNARNAVFLQDARIDRFQLDALDARTQQQVAAVADVLANKLVRDVPLYTFRVEELRYAGVQFVPTSIRTTPQGLLIHIEPLQR
jgi:ABC-type sugar transport system ATPase subunit